MKNRICIIIQNANESNKTLETLTFLSALDDTLFTSLVVDQESTRESIQAIRAAFPRVPIFECLQNRGVAAGNNLAIAWALKKPFHWIILLRNGSLVSPDFLKKFMHSVNEAPTAKLFQTASRSVYFIHRDVFASIGLFDPRFLLFWDKADFISRAARKGFHYKTLASENSQREKALSLLKHQPKNHYYWWKSYLLWAERNQLPFLRKKAICPKIFKLLKTYLFIILNKQARQKHLPYLHSSLAGVCHYFFNKFKQ